MRKIKIVNVHITCNIFLLCHIMQIVLTSLPQQTFLEEVGNDEYQRQDQISRLFDLTIDSVGFQKIEMDVEWNMVVMYFPTRRKTNTVE